MVLVTFRQGRTGRVGRQTRIGCGSDHRFGLPLENLVGFQHRMHDDRELARHGDGNPLKADPLPQLQTLGSLRTVGRGSGQHHGCLVSRMRDWAVSWD